LNVGRNEAAAVIAEKGFEGATMAEIAARSDTKIGSLYRFFPNKESLADKIVVGARKRYSALNFFAGTLLKDSIGGVTRATA
jgi:AcrR family transcriptional regulator